jgi:hypothetical protein
MVASFCIPLLLLLEEAACPSARRNEEHRH